MIRVLVAEDSATVRALLVSILSSDSEIEVVAEAADGREAVRLTDRMRPDVITMDIHMPIVDGMEATEEIMSKTPTPIVIVSSAVRKEDMQMSLQATQAGALTAITKPEGPSSPDFDAYSRRLIDMVKAMSQVKVIRRWKKHSPRPSSATVGATTPSHSTPAYPVRAFDEEDLKDIEGRKAELIAIAASTGGPAAVQQVLTTLPSNFPLPILVVQHIATGFMEALVGWLDASCALKVKSAVDGEILRPGTVYIAPDDKHLGIIKGRIMLNDGKPVGGFRPSGTELFRSVAKMYGPSVVGVILTGMGRDGVEGLRELHKAGGYVIAQDEATSVVYGMPQEAVKAAIVDRVLPLSAIGPAIAKFG